MRIVIGCLLALLVAGVVVALTSSGGGSDNSPGGQTKVVAAFYPIAFAAEQIDPSADVKNLTPPGAEPHDLEVTPQDVQDLQSADLVLLMGQGFQPQLEKAAGQGSAGEVVKLLDTPGLGLKPGDPHVWLDPPRFEKLVTRIGEALGDPAAADRFNAKLAALDNEYRSGLANCKRKEIVTSHEAFGYMAEDYGLTQVAITGISPEAEPTPAALQAAVDAVRKTGATTVFTEPLVSPKLSETVARETGATTDTLNPIEGLTPDEQSKGEDYFSIMRENLAALRQALECQ
jgi:zinc transport system substrate-binding protein